jgi:phosphoribosyl 1,2-cyclic phosphodiesterase
MEVISLQSGSSGNCVFVRIGQTRLLFDAGISGRKAQTRLALHGHDIHDIDALIISHDHSDHVSGLGPIHRRFGLPVYMTVATQRVVEKKRNTGPLRAVQNFRSGEEISFGDVNVHTIPTPHDAVDGVCFVVEDLIEGTRFGLMTDLGYHFDELNPWIVELDALMIESNYDPVMLRNGFYPDHLKERITGRGGHLSNDEAAKLVRDHAPASLQWVCLAHLSDENNTPEVATRTCRRYVRDDLQIFCADRRDVIAPMLVSPKPAQPQGGRTRLAATRPARQVSLF